jgi:YHS domain-containing protein
MVRGVFLLGLIGALLGEGVVGAADGEIPKAFAPLEHLIGSWKGTAVPSANRLKGWPETHAWAWKFAGGKPVGMSLEFKGNRGLARGVLTFDDRNGRYRLEGTDPDGKPLTFVGAFDKTGKMLVLDREGGPPAEGKDRLTIRPNSNLIRYTMDFDHQEPGAPQFKRVTEVGLTKEGESFAAGGAAQNLPKCILTGGAATMTVSYQGRTYPVCCSGCRDEFNEDPEKYARKAAAVAEADGRAPAKAASSRANKDDGAFDGLADPAPRGATPKAVPPAAKAAAEPSAAKSVAETKEARAASLMRLGSNLEKGGKPDGALKYYRQVVKEYPDTTSAKAAAARIKALGG